MKIPRARLTTALGPLVFGVAAVVAAGATPVPARADRLAAAPATVVIGCLGQRQVRPPVIVLACADGNAYLSGLRWATWGPAARGTGTWRINDCVPICARGRFQSFPARVLLRRPEPLPRHRGVRYYSLITTVLPGRRCYSAQGRRTCYPARYTGDLWSTTAGPLPASPWPATRPPGPAPDPPAPAVAAAALAAGASPLPGD